MQRFLYSFAWEYVTAALRIFQVKTFSALEAGSRIMHQKHSKLTIKSMFQYLPVNLMTDYLVFVRQWPLNTGHCECGMVHYFWLAKILAFVDMGHIIEHVLHSKQSALTLFVFKKSPSISSWQYLTIYSITTSSCAKRTARTFKSHEHNLTKGL